MTVTMAGKKRTSPQEWVQDYFSPVLSVLTSQDVEVLSQKNNLTFTEILQPFSKLLTDVTLKDVDGTNHNVPSLNIILQDFKKDPQKLVSQKLMLDRLSEENCEESSMVARTFGQICVDAPGYTPWYDIWMKLYLQSLPTVDHEYLKHHLGCIFVVSTSASNPVEQLRALSQTQHRHQHDKPGTYPQYFNPNIMKCYILVHDVYSGVDDAKAQEMFTQVQAAFEPTCCHFLQLNSRIPDEGGGATGISDHWFTFSHRFHNIEVRKGSNFVATPGTYHAPVTANPVTGPSENSSELSDQELDHPLAVNNLPPDTPPPHQPQAKLTQATRESVSKHLTANDIDRIRILMRELVIKCLIPYVEKQLRVLQEIVTNRKSRSFLSATKRWFSTSKQGTAGGTSVVYSKEAPELQVRKLADLYFMMKLYKPAYNLFYIAKKDFQTDEAWPYYAAAVELAALSMFMLAGSDAGKKYRPDYMEDAITKYLTLCQTPEFAVRATLFDGLCLKQQGMFQEAAASYIRMTNELSDLRSAVLLEQAAYCFLLATPASVRKYGFHIVLAGYRFTKTGSCKKHAARLYTQGAQVYDGKGWMLSSDHILYTLAHQTFMLKDYKVASSFFNDLMAAARGKNHLQQMVHLREFFLVHHARAKEDKSVVAITLPKLHSQEICVSLQGPEVPNSPVLDQWQSLEKVAREVITGNEIIIMSQTCQQVFSSTSDNRLMPQGVVGEPICVTVPLENVFQTPLLMKRSYLLWKFTSADGQTELSNENKDAENKNIITTEVLESATIEKSSISRITFKITVHSPGELIIIGMEYSLKALFPEKDPTDHEIRGKQFFSVTGRRMNVNKDAKTRIVIGKDQRLSVNVKSPQPRLAASLNAPESLLQGELRCVELELENHGQVSMSNIHLICQTPGLLSFGKRSKALNESSKKSIFDFKLIQESLPAFRTVQPNGEVVQVSLDVIPIPLPEKNLGLIAPNSSLKIPVWIRGPSRLGDTKHDVFIYYENSEEQLKPKSKHPHRIYHMLVQSKVLPSLTIEAQSSPTCLHQNHESFNIVIHVRNKSKELMTSMDTISITQVSLVSRNKEVNDLQSSPGGCSVARGELSSISLKSVIKETISICDNDSSSRVVPTSSKQAVDGGNVYFSSITTSSSSNGHSIQSPPFVDFLKDRFNYGARKEPPVLKSDTVVVMWRSGGSSPVIGQHICPVDPFTPPPDLENPPTEHPPHHPVAVYTEYMDAVEHDFTQAPFVSVVVNMKVVNSSVAVEDKGVLFEYRVVEQEEGVRWTGPLDGLIWLEPDGDANVKLGVSVTSPGLFHLKNLRFRAKIQDQCDRDYFTTCTDKFVPVDVNLLVTQPDVNLLVTQPEV